MPLTREGNRLLGVFLGPGKILGEGNRAHSISYFTPLFLPLSCRQSLKPHPVSKK